jgi:hypothetical protein
MLQRASFPQKVSFIVSRQAVRQVNVSITKRSWDIGLIIMD